MVFNSATPFMFLTLIHHIWQNTVGCNYLSLPEIPASGAKGLTLNQGNVLSVSDLGLTISISF